MNHIIIYRKRLLAYSETFIKDQAEALRQWDYTFLTKERIVGLEVQKNKVILINEYTGRKTIPRLLDFLESIFRRRKANVLAQIKARSPQLLHIHFGTDAVDIFPYIKSLKLPVVITLHGFDITTNKSSWQSGEKGRSKIRYPEDLLKLAILPNVHFIAISEAIKKTAISFGIPSEKLHVHYIGVDTLKFSPFKDDISKRSNKVIFVGRLVEKKGVDILIRAFFNVSRLLPDAELIIVGDGPQLESLKELAFQLDLSVSFVGVKTRDQIIQLFSIVKVLCLPSITAANGDAEGLGMVILEAQACGIPVITSARGGATEGIVNNQTGFAFQEGNIQQLSEHLIELLTNNNCLDEMSKNASKFVSEKFSLASCTQRLELFYNDLLSRE